TAGEVRPGEEKPTEKPAEKPADERKAKDTCWAKLPIGAVIEVKTTSENKGTGKSESTTKYTLKERKDKVAIVEVASSMTVPGVAPIQTSEDKEFPLVENVAPAGASDAKGPKPTISKESLEVKGFGKVAVEKYVVKETVLGVQKSLSTTWMDPDNNLPNPIKSSYETPVMSSQIEIVGVKLPGAEKKKEPYTNAPPASAWHARNT